MRRWQGAVKVVALVVLILVSSGWVLVLGSGLGLGRLVESRYRCFGMVSSCIEYRG